MFFYTSGSRCLSPCDGWIFFIPIAMYLQTTDSKILKKIRALAYNVAVLLWMQLILG